MTLTYGIARVTRGGYGPGLPEGSDANGITSPAPG